MDRLILSLIVLPPLAAVGRAQTWEIIDASTTISADLPSGIQIIDGLDPPTSVDLLDPAAIGGDAWVRDSSVFSMIGGSIQGDLRPSDSSTTNVFGGRVRVDVDARESSTLNISGGDFDEIINARDQSVVNISGGSVYHDEGASLQVFNSATVNISGGSFARTLYVWDSGQLNLSGGSFDGNLITVQSGASVDVYGYNLQLADHLLTGTWADGTPIDLSIWYDPAATITLHNIPEPGILVGLIGLGFTVFGIHIRRRRRRR
jgi:hypothetical protein